jgi:hypothetical protein
MLFYNRAIARERRHRAERIITVNLGMAGGDKANEAIKQDLED